MKKYLIPIFFLVAPVAANSTAAWGYDGTRLDYYWVPGNLLLFHIDYPWDFALYGFAIIGFLWVAYQVYCMVLRWFP